MENLQTMVKVKDLNSNLIMEMSIQTLLEKYLNIDRSEGWIDYNLNDWKEGFQLFCDDLELIES